MSAIAWNPHRYIEFFGSKERLQKATGLHNKSFGKAILSKRINETIKEYLDQVANFNQVDKYPKLEELIEEGKKKFELMELYKCSLPTLNKELSHRFKTTNISSCRAKIRRNNLKSVDLSKVDENLLFALRNFSNFKAIGYYICLSERGARHKVFKIFGTSDMESLKIFVGM